MIAKIRDCFIYASLLLIAFSCTKDVPPELQTGNRQKMTDNQKMPDDSIHRKFMNHPDQMSDSKNEQGESGSEKEESEDEGANKICKAADESDAKYSKTKSESDKTACIEKQLAAANYLMFEADLPPREKYKPALRDTEEFLNLIPENKEAAENKEQIEDIYKSLGKPIPN